MIWSGPTERSEVVTGMLRDRSRLAGAIGVEAIGEHRIVQGEHGGGQQRGIDRARLADGERPDGNAAGI